MSDTNPSYGDLVTYYDGDGETENAIVVDPVKDSEYVTVVTGAGDEFGDEFGEGYNHDVESHSSAYPHADLGDEFTATSYAFKPGWNAEED